VAFGVLVVVGRLEGTHSLAHKWKVSRERADGKDEWLSRVVPGFIRMTVFVKKGRSQPAATSFFITTIKCDHIAPASDKVRNQYPEMIPYHDTTSFTISRQS
jgi:hypothetical protein